MNRRYRVLVNPSVIDEFGSSFVLGHYHSNWRAILAAWWHISWHPRASATVQYRDLLLPLPTARTIPRGTR